MIEKINYENLAFNFRFPKESYPDLLRQTLDAINTEICSLKDLHRALIKNEEWPKSPKPAKLLCRINNRLRLARIIGIQIEQEKPKENETK